MGWTLNTLPTYIPSHNHNIVHAHTRRYVAHSTNGLTTKSRVQYSLQRLFDYTSSTAPSLLIMRENLTITLYITNHQDTDHIFFLGWQTSVWGLASDLDLFLYWRLIASSVHSCPTGPISMHLHQLANYTAQERHHTKWEYYQTHSPYMYNCRYVLSAA